MNKVQNADTRQAILQHTNKCFMECITQSFNITVDPPEHYSYRKKAQMLGISNSAIDMYVLAEMARVVGISNKDTKIIDSPVESMKRVLSIRQAAYSWGVSDEMVDIAFKLYGSSLMTSAFS